MKKIKVFQLDDDKSQLKLLEAVCKRDEELEYFGYDNTKDFLKALKEEEPSVCLIDLNLQEGNGVGFIVLEAIRNNFSNDLPIFILSRRNASKDISNAFELGVTDYIIKPISLKERPFLII